MDEVANRCVDGRHSAAAIDGTLADIASRVDAQSHEYRRARRPFAQHVVREVPAGQNGADEMRRFGDAIVSASPWAVAARAAPSPIAEAAGTRTGATNVGRTLYRGSAGPGCLGGSDLLYRRSHDPWLGNDDRRRFAPNVPGGRSALSFLGLGLLTLLRRGRRRNWRNIAQVENPKRGLCISEIDLPRHMQQGEKQRRMNGDNRADRPASIAIVYVGPIGHG